jgi:hypothetical protein
VTALFQQPHVVSYSPPQSPTIAERSEQAQYTTGSYVTEDDAAAALDQILMKSGLWVVYREVCGSLCQPRPAQSGKGMRIDRVLLPTPRLIGLGWAHGVIGIEIKRSGINIGPPIAQAMDYSRSAWVLDQLGSIRVWLDWVFIWPMPAQGSTVASILAQNRIGSASTSPYQLLHLQGGSGQNLITISHSGDIRIGAGASGRKAGSR